MTLSKFLADYLYIPLGGNRKGPVRRYINLTIVMLLGGLWHGAGWNFVLWGGLHGVYLVLNHAWRGFTNATDHLFSSYTTTSYMLLTFIAVTFAWVPFRATTLETTIQLWQGMVGMNGFSLPIMFEQHFSSILGTGLQYLTPVSGINMANAFTWVAIGLVVVWFLPNTQQWFGDYSPFADEQNKSIKSYFTWRPSLIFAIITGIVFAIAVISFKKNSPFLYFQF